MKSGTASLIIAYACLYERRHLLSGSVALCAVADEETGGKWGTKYLIEQDKHRWDGDLMLCAEPGGLETIRFAEKGTLRLACTVKTKGALGPYLYLSKGAIRTTSAFINEVTKSVEALPVDLPVEMERHLEKPEVKRAIDQSIGPGTTTIIARPTVNVGTIKGGLKVNMIPETCIFELDIRLPVGMREDTVLDLIDTIIPQYEPASITIKKQAAASNPFNYSEINPPIVGHLKDNAKSLRPDADAPIPIPSMGGSDCKHYRYADFPAYIFGCSPATTKAVSFGVASPELDNHVAEHDLDISLVPFVRHAAIVQLAIKGKTNFVTIGYDFPAIHELEYQAKTARITVLNEVGVDPPYAIKTIGEVHEKYESGALLSQLNSTTFLQDGKVIEISIEEHTIIRGPLRCDGNPALVKALINLGWFDTGPRDWLKEGKNWSRIQHLTGAVSTAEVGLLTTVDELRGFRSPEARSKILVGLKWTGLFSDEITAVCDPPPRHSLRSTGQAIENPGRCTSSLSSGSTERK
ncbi:Saccharopine dehydrogenase [Fusarium acutatum]|uniref:Saccharopine dehydrogenase n=1 Tax=Fusarium acutatum TaxID=78861 RepID=A0A8H4NLX9_9HYPO|nr:Saccharopine dehydrogenase [Fusarium acutatum]